MVRTILIAVYENTVGDTSIFQNTVFELGSFYLIIFGLNQYRIFSNSSYVL
jgi:hypothetical protein